MLALDISPLQIVPVCPIRQLILIEELVLAVGWPRDVGLIPHDFSAVVVAEREGVVEVALGNQAARNGNVVRIQCFP